jgi:hypothetical protein
MKACIWTQRVWRNGGIACYTLCDCLISLNTSYAASSSPPLPSMRMTCIHIHIHIHANTRSTSESECHIADNRTSNDAATLQGSNACALHEQRTVSGYPSNALCSRVQHYMTQSTAYQRALLTTQAVTWIHVANGLEVLRKALHKHYWYTTAHKQASCYVPCCTWQ